MESEIILPKSTCNEIVDSALHEIIDTFETTFPSRICSYYITGSYADSSAVASSDIDVLVIFKDSFDVQSDEQKCAGDVARKLVEHSVVELDIELADEQGLAGGIDPNLKMGSLLVYGEDIRDRLPLISLREWTRDRMHSSFWRTVHLWGRPAVVTYPLDYPDPSEKEVSAIG